MPQAPIVHVARYLAGGVARVGRVEGDHLRRLTAPPWAGGVETGETDRVAEVTLLPPVEPSKVVCVGLNYRSHIAESLSVVPGAKPPEEPLIFLKPPSSVIASGDCIRYPPGVTRLDPEAELAVVIGRRARRVSVEDAPGRIAGITAFNDVSARNYQRQDGQWTRAKGFDTFAPLGPWVTTGLSPERLEITCRVNGETRQHGNTAELLFPVPFLIHFVSQIMTLEPGDVIATGTPAGIAPIRLGDVVEVEVEGVGVLRNSVAEWGD